MHGMELRLGLSLSTHQTNEGFDDHLKNKGFERKEIVGMVPLRNDGWLDNKRSFEEDFWKIKESAQTLPLLLWSGQPNDEDDRKGTKKRKSCSINKNENDEEENHVVGWPPVRSWRKKLFHQPKSGHGGSNSMYVKAKMEGVGIARKVDLRLYNSYETLTKSLIRMFDRCQNIEKDEARYTLTYQDKDGDWLLAGDVPWWTFMESVQRLVIVRNVN